MIIPIGKTFVYIPDQKVNNTDIDVNGLGLEELPLWIIGIIAVIVFILFIFLIEEIKRG